MFYWLIIVHEGRQVRQIKTTLKTAEGQVTRLVQLDFMSWLAPNGSNLVPL